MDSRLLKQRRSGIFSLFLGILACYGPSNALVNEHDLRNQYQVFSYTLRPLETLNEYQPEKIVHTARGKSNFYGEYVDVYYGTGERSRFVDRGLFDALDPGETCCPMICIAWDIHDPSDCDQYIGISRLLSELYRVDRAVTVKVLGIKEL